MKDDRPKIPALIEHAGELYVSVNFLVASAKDPQVLANTVALLKIGVDQKVTLAEVLAHILANYALSVSGVSPGIKFTPEELGRFQSTLDMVFSGSMPA